MVAQKMGNRQRVIDAIEFRGSDRVPYLPVVDARRFQLERPEDLPKIQCDRKQIRQVIMNLLVNARDALNQEHHGQQENKRILITSCVLELPGGAQNSRTALLLL